MSKIKVALYPRVSTQEQADEGYSIGEQIERLTKYCEAMDWIIYKTYTDAGFSGGDINRPGLQAMLKDVRAGKLDKVVVYKLDRLSRSQKDTMMLIEDEFLAHGVDFVSVSENFDTSTPLGRAMIGILAVFAQLERENIKERMSMGREARAKKGLYHGSSYRTAIGYDYVDGQLIVNEYEAMIVREIFGLYNSGVSIKKITDLLNEKGLTHRYGKWSYTTIRRLLPNRTYIGEIRYQGDTWYQGQHEPIIDCETFEAVNKILERSKERYLETHTLESTHTTILGGLLYCGKCGARYGKARSGRLKDGSYYMYYTCNSKSKRVKSDIRADHCNNKTWKMDELNEIVFDEIRKLKADPKYLESLRTTPDDQTPDQREIIQSEIDSLQKSISAYMDLYALKGVLSLDQVDAKIKPLSERVQKLENELASLADPKESVLDEKKTRRLIDSFEGVLDRGNFDEIRLLITTLINRIDIYDEDIAIHWNFT